MAIISLTKIKSVFSSIRVKIALAFLLIMGISYIAVANSLNGLVGDYLFNEQKQSNQSRILKISKDISPLFYAKKALEINEYIDFQASDLSSRLLVLDSIGKVQSDSDSLLNGQIVTLPETVDVLVNNAPVSFGVHRYEASSSIQGIFPSSAYNARKSIHVSYTVSPLLKDNKIIGAVLLSSPMQPLISRLQSLQNQVSFYFSIAALAVLICSVIFSEVITKPIKLLTNGIRRMGKGDFSTRVPEIGTGELRTLTETYNTMSTKLEMLDNSRNLFISNASHELKTPLATMKILLESIIYQPEMDKELQTEFLTDINKEIDRLNLIIGDLLTLVSMDAQTIRLNKSTFDFADIVTDIVNKLSLVAAQRQQEIKLQISDRCEMTADHAKLTQVVFNLLDNAIKYSFDKGVIRVRLVRSGRNAILTIVDNGAGIPKSDLTHIFDRFYRVDKARSRDTGGTGLGLSIVNQMVLIHGGSVSVDSEEGKGSTFITELPLNISKDV